jgi:hypothetical protein
MGRDSLVLAAIGVHGSGDGWPICVDSDDSGSGRVPRDWRRRSPGRDVAVVRHPCMMPFITAFFLPRRAGDRPAVVPQVAVNFGFLGQFAESSPRDVIFTVEYSVRTAMEAVYTLLDIERGVPASSRSRSKDPPPRHGRPLVPRRHRQLPLLVSLT